MTRLEATRLLVQHRRNTAAAQEMMQLHETSQTTSYDNQTHTVQQESRVQDVITRNEEESTNETNKKTKTMKVISQARHEELILTDHITRYSGNAVNYLIEDLQDSSASDIDTAFDSFLHDHVE